MAWRHGIKHNSTMMQHFVYISWYHRHWPLIWIAKLLRRTVRSASRSIKCLFTHYGNTRYGIMPSRKIPKYIVKYAALALRKNHHQICRWQIKKRHHIMSFVDTWMNIPVISPRTTTLWDAPKRCKHQWFNKHGLAVSKIIKRQSPMSVTANNVPSVDDHERAHEYRYQFNIKQSVIIA